MLELFKIKYKELSKIKRLQPRDQGHYLPFDSYPHGCPLGGFGTGTIGRSPYGDFNIWHIKVGAHIEEELKACTFHLYQKQNKKRFSNVLTARSYKDNKLTSFAEPFKEKDGSYSAAFPKAKYTFNDRKAPVKVECEQFSPVMPDNYKESSYPVAVFKYKLTNKSNKPAEAAVMMSWANMLGWKFKDMRPGVQDSWYSFIRDNEKKLHKIKRSKNYLGIVLGRDTKKAQNQMEGEICLATELGNDRVVTTQKYFFNNGTGEELTKPFYKKGELKDLELGPMEPHQNYGSAVAVKVKLRPGQTKEIPFVLVWDLPIAEFGPKILIIGILILLKRVSCWKILQIRILSIIFKC